MAVESNIQPIAKKELFNKLFKGTEENDKVFCVGKYWPDPVGLPKLFEIK